jgi:hypothetical protein
LIVSNSTFPNLFKFLEKLENSTYLIQIKSLNISRLPESKLQTKEYEGFSKEDAIAKTFSTERIMSGELDRIYGTKPKKTVFEIYPLPYCRSPELTIYSP